MQSMPDRVVAAGLLGDDQLGADAVRADRDAEVRRHLEHGGVVAGQRHDARGAAGVDRPQHADERADRPVGGAHVDAGPCVRVSHRARFWRTARTARGERGAPRRPRPQRARGARARSPRAVASVEANAATPAAASPTRPLAHGGADEHRQPDLPRQPRRVGPAEAARPRDGERRAAARDARPERRALGEAEQEAVAPVRVRRRAAGRRAVGGDQRRRAGEQSGGERAGVPSRASIRSCEQQPRERRRAAPRRRATPAAGAGAFHVKRRAARRRVPACSATSSSLRRAPSSRLTSQPSSHGTAVDVARRGHRQQLDRAVQQPERDRSQRGASAAGSAVPARPRRHADEQPDHAEHDHRRDRVVDVVQVVLPALPVGRRPRARSA